MSITKTRMVPPLAMKVGDLYRKGLEVSEIAQTLGKSSTTVSRNLMYLRQVGVLPPKARPYPIDKVKLLLALEARNRGTTVKALSRKILELVATEHLFSAILDD
jgi:hypothetical protein